MASFYDLLAQDDDERRALEFADRLNPAEALMADRRLFEQRAVRGVEDLGRGMLGLPASVASNREAAARELKALAQTVRPGTVEFYDKAAAILQKHGLPAEAEKMESARRQLEIGKGEMDPLMKMQQAREELARKLAAGDVSVKPAIEALDRKIAAYGKPTAQAGQDPEFIKLLNAYEAAVVAAQPERAAQIKKALDAWLASKAKTGADMTPYQKETLDIRRAAEERAKTKDERKATADEAAVVGALQGTVRALDVELPAAKRLLIHPGLGKITGSVNGALPLRAVGVASGGAAAIYMTLEGQLFIRALQDLKATSKTGASGLGQLTEIEGNKIQAAKAALDRQQPTDQFKRTLSGYIVALEDGRKIAVGELTKAGAEVPTVPQTISDAPERPDPREMGRSAPAPAAAKRTFKSTPVK